MLLRIKSNHSQPSGMKARIGKLHIQSTTLYHGSFEQNFSRCVHHQEISGFISVQNSHQQTILRTFAALLLQVCNLRKYITLQYLNWELLWRLGKHSSPYLFLLPLIFKEPFDTVILYFWTATPEAEVKQHGMHFLFLLCLPCSCHMNTFRATSALWGPTAGGNWAVDWSIPAGAHLMGPVSSITLFSPSTP